MQVEEKIPGGNILVYQMKKILTLSYAFFVTK